MSFEDMVRFDSCPACQRTITSFARPVGTIRCQHCKADLKYAVIPPEGYYGAYRTLVRVP